MADGLLAGEGGHGRLQNLYNLLSARRQRMVAQVASFYPLTSGPPVTSTEGKWMLSVINFLSRFFFFPIFVKE